MGLCYGKVENDKLTCPFHGWQYSPGGEVTNPEGSFHGRTRHYETRQAWGILWVRDADCQHHPFPLLDDVEYIHLMSNLYTAAAPYQFVMDIFTEAEHTADAHFLLGFDPARRSDIQTRTTIHDRCIVIENSGPQKPAPWPLSLLMPFQNNDYFSDTIHTHFTPPYTQYDHYWYNVRSGQERSLKLRYYMFFKPRNTRETDVFLIGFAQSPLLQLGVARKAACLLMKLVSDNEMRMDMQTLARISDKSIAPTI